MMTRNLTLAALSLALVVPAANAQQALQGANAQQAQQGANAQQAQQGATGSNRMAVNDTLFAAAAASGGLAELSISELGVQRATDPQLKQFSQRMIDEHTRMNTELMQLAAKKQIPLPRALDYRAQFCGQSLAGLSGEEFDRCYSKAQLLSHMDAVGIFEAEAERGQDPEVKALAAKALPHIKDHLRTIRPIAIKFEKEKHEAEGRTEHRAGAPAAEKQ